MVATLHRVADMDPREQKEAQLNRPVREEQARRAGPPVSVYGCAALVVLVAVCAALGFGGLFPAWVVMGVLVVGAGVIVVVQLARRNRGLR
ncbi:MAG TPA: hypothetical protein VF911_12440 [Thermoanaerobaculia bacterium]